MIIKYLGQVDYEPIFHEMMAFTESRDDSTEDEIWVLEHNPVYTLGKSAMMEHLLAPQTKIPLVQTDRGGQITYHGPGQLVFYTLINFKVRQITVHDLVTKVAQAAQKVLEKYGIQSDYDNDRPGLYVQGKKIASLGFRIHKNAVYHGMSLNVDMDLKPFLDINPCGYSGLEMTSMALETHQNFDEQKRHQIAQEVVDKLEKNLVYSNSATE